MNPLLIELGTEELPVKALPELAAAFADGIVAALDKRGVAHGAARTLYSPRRLAVQIDAVADKQPEQRSEVLGPYLNIGLDANGEPTPALRGFAQKNGLDPNALERITDAKGERFVARRVTPGASTAELLPAVIEEAIKAMPIPKPMRWGDHAYAFARPVHWLVVLHGEQAVDVSLLGVKSGRHSRGHRFHSPGPVAIPSADGYVDTLHEANVLVDPAARRERIRAEIERAASQAGGRARVDADVLEQVNCLTEWPSAVLCSFEREFLRVPQEALILTMETNQKFFPVLDGEGRLTERFIGIANIESRNVDEVRKGYERVIRPRFADARFFFDEDVKQGLAAMNAGLASVTYQQKLGSYADKVARVKALAAALAPQLGVDSSQAERAAELAKADLQSRMVGEFPELQGIMGRHYAVAGGESVQVAAAIDEAYQPRFAGDAIAASKLGQLLAICERLDTLAGGFAAGLKPSGNKDPFALRRAALGLARTLIEAGMDLDLPAAFECAITGLPAGAGQASADELMDFVYDRLRGYYGDQRVPGSHFEAVLALRPKSLGDFDHRLKAIAAFAELSEAEALAAANKRIRNILRKTDEAIPGAVDAAALAEDAERALHAAVEAALADTDAALAQRDYVAVLKRLAALRVPVDRFFDGVMVMAEDPTLRRNRLALLKRLSDRFLAVADISQLSVA